jgi:hypothetical protein
VRKKRSSTAANSRGLRARIMVALAWTSCRTGYVMSIFPSSFADRFTRASIKKHLTT